MGSIIKRSCFFVSEYLLILVSAASAVLALLFAFLKSRIVLKAPEGSSLMQKISLAVRTGAHAYLKRQYRVVIIFFALVFVVLLVLAFFGFLTYFVPFAYITGGFFSGLSGFIGMSIATRANARTANAARMGLDKGLRIAFSAGNVMGFTVVGLGLLDITIWYFLLKFVFKLDIADVAAVMITFGMGASSMALFARVGGGIFTKAADIGADLVGKVEAGIPEDDIRNPAVIADNVGDNVGDVAGMGADLYESYVGSILSTSALGVVAFGSGLTIQAAALPIVLAGIGVLASIIGTLFVHTKEDANQKTLLNSLRRGTNSSAIIGAAASFFAVWAILGIEYYGIWLAIVAGLIGGVLIGLSTELFTSDTYKPTQKLAKSSETGTATMLIGGIGLGMASTFLPILIVGAAVIVAYFCSGISNPGDGNLGLYGISLAAVGMLSTLGITLSTDAYGPVADNAGGIAQMAALESEVRARTDALDSLGNTTAATGKGFAIGSAALTALALIANFVEKIKEAGGSIDLSIMNPALLVGIFVGACLPFIFSAMTIQSVGRAAQSIVQEVRRQFREIKGLIEGKADPDYATCVDICTKASLKEMILPTCTAFFGPIVIGLLLGASGVAGLLCGATVTGFILAIFMANAGGAWDNAKKYIESGEHGGKHSESHKAAVVGDTVGDPLKDTAGPSINILIKLLSMVSIVFSALIAGIHLI